MAKRNIVVLEGDGIGPEIMHSGLIVLDAIAKKYEQDFNLESFPFGAKAFFDYGSCYPDAIKKAVMNADAVLKGPVGLDSAGRAKLQTQLLEKGMGTVEQATVLALRGDLGTSICYRPVYLPKELAFFSPLRPEIIGGGINILMMRELLGGIYFGEKTEGIGKDGKILDYSRDDCTYTRRQVDQFAHACFKEAKERGIKLTNIHKDNVKATGRFWKAIFNEVGKKNPDLKLEDCLVDSFATFLCTKPTSFNGVVALENMEGDILTDQAGGIIGSLGLMPSACVNSETGQAYYEPSHGSAPDIAGKGSANPYSMIGSVAFMLEKSFGLKKESQIVWKALSSVFAQGHMTRELVRKLTEEQEQTRAEDDMRRLYTAFHTLDPTITPERARGLILYSNRKYDEDLEKKVVSTKEFTDLVVKNILVE